MANASWIYADLAGLIFAILCVVVFGVFMDDLLNRFLWTKGPPYWTRARLRLSSAGFQAVDGCKTTISAWKERRANAALQLDALRGRLVARFDRGRLTLRESAVWYAPRKRRWGERFLPHAAVGSIHLKPAQQRAVSALTADPASELTRGQYEELAGVSRSQAAYDLAELVEAGFLERVGNGRATRYRLAREGGAQRHWTSERIRAELQAFCSGRKLWPSAADFKEAGRGDLYVAASRYGGIGHWAEVLGFPRSPRGASAAPERSPVRARLAWAGGGALAALVVGGVVGAIVFSAARHGAAPTASPRHGVLGAQANKQAILPAAARAKKTRPAHTRKVQRQRARPSQATRSRLAGSGAGPTHWTTQQPSSTFAVANTRTLSAVTHAQTSGPAPLPAPSGSSPPNPLKAP
jgi:hypothetical protein